MKTPLAALLTFTLITTSTAIYKCLDSAPHLQCCKNHPFGCQIRSSPLRTHLCPPSPQLQLTVSPASLVRDPDQDPAKPPGASYQPADLAAFTAACQRIGGAEAWAGCCYIDPKIVSWLATPLLCVRLGISADGGIDVV